MELFLRARHLFKRAKSVLVTSAMVEPHTPRNPDFHIDAGDAAAGDDDDDDLGLEPTVQLATSS